MKRFIPFLAAVALLGACRDSNAAAPAGLLSASFQSVPLGFESAQHSFAGAADGTNPEWGPRSMGPGGDHRGPGGGGDRGPGFGELMGGGLGGLFFGDGFGPGFGHGGRGEPSLV